MQQVTISKPIVQTPMLWRDYLSLTKPRVLSLLLLTTLGAMLIAGESLPSASTILATLVGGYLAAGGAGTLNCYFDRDIDRMMSRTRLRPLPSGRIASQHALWFGLGLILLAFFVLWFGANLLTAGLAMTGAFIYVVVYSLWLKRTSPQNIVIGGAAGAVPPMVGWAAVTGELGPEAILLFAIIFCWTPPHFWCLALVRRVEYARAGVPMYPVVYGSSQTYTSIIRYTWLLFFLTLLPSLLGMAGIAYGVGAFMLGAYFLQQAIRLSKKPSTAATWRLYRYSLLYLALLFVALVIDHQLSRVFPLNLWG